MCTHRSSCPAAESPAPAHIVVGHPEQGWSLLCDGTIVFDDTGELRPGGRVVAPHRMPGGPVAMAA
ncbi:MULTISPECIES: DUF5999 family protein [Streptomyces]|uniref:DUF5999 family protein n=1 Tax=Streptomyces lienomycini TaxID=284035 RepID=A0ABV9WTR1_9ACTN|nr:MULTISPECIES: DUF5999 family protein [Streptomyces]